MERLYFSISEVSELVDEEQHILRYWEKEFSQLKPKKNRGGNRAYSRKDIELIRLVKKLMRNEKLSLKAAKDFLAKMDLSKLEEGVVISTAKPIQAASVKNEIRTNEKSKPTETISKAKEYVKQEATAIAEKETSGDEKYLNKQELKEILEAMKQALQLLKN